MPEFGYLEATRPVAVIAAGAVEHNKLQPCV